MRQAVLILAVIICVFTTNVYAAAGSVTPASATSTSRAAIVHWSNLTRRAIVPPGPEGVFGSENYGNKFPGEAAVYMAIVHAAMYDAVVAVCGSYRPYAIALTAPERTSLEAGIATAAHHVLAGLQPELGLSASQQAALDADYDGYLRAIPEGPEKSNGIAVGAQVASAVLATRANDGRELNPAFADLSPPPAGPGVWTPNATPALGLRLPRIRPLALTHGAQFRPDGPNGLSSHDYANDFREVADLGPSDSTARTDKQTESALFWTDHDLRQWNDGLLRLAEARDLDLLQTARMLAMAHVAGGDAMIACFDAKYTYWFWRPHQAIPQAETDGNEATAADPSWKPLRPAPNFPEYPSAHACHTTAVAEALKAFFGTDRVTFTLDSRVTGTSRVYKRLHDVIVDVDWARVLAGFHFRNSDQEGSALGRKVGRYVTATYFQRTEAPRDQRLNADPK